MERESVKTKRPAAAAPAEEEAGVRGNGENGQAAHGGQAAPEKHAKKGFFSALAGRARALLGSVDWKTAAVLVLLFLLAFGIRAHNIQDDYEYFFGFDSYYHARMASYVIQNGAVPDRDPAAYYYDRIGYADIPGTGSFFWFFTAAIYKLATLGAPYNKALWIEFVKVLPALFGALISVAMYFFARALYGRRAGVAAGLATALVASVIPSFVYRTMAGFFEEDSLGFLWMVLGFAFFAYALKEPAFSRWKVAAAALAGGFFAVMAWTWDFFLIVPILLALYLPFGAALVYLKQGTRRLASFLALFAISAGALTVFASLKDGGYWATRAVGYVANSLPFNPAEPGVALALAFFGAILAGLVYLLTATGSEAVREKNKRFLLLALSALFAVGFLVVLAVLQDPGGFFASKFTGTGVLGTTIGEESIGNPTFGYKYNLLILIPFLALLLIPLRLHAVRNEHLSVLVFFWIAVSLIMAFYKLKFTYIFGLPIALGAGLVVAEFLRSMQGRLRTASAIVVFSVTFPAVFAMAQPGGALHPLVSAAAVSAVLAAIAWSVAASLSRAPQPGVTKTARAVALVLAFVLLTGIAAGSMFVTKRPPSIEAGDSGKMWKDVLFWLRDHTEPDARIFNWWDRGHWITFIAERTVALDNRNYDFEGDSDYAKFVLGIRKDPETKRGAVTRENGRERFQQGLEYSLELLREYRPDYVLLDNGFFNPTSLLGYADHVSPRDINPFSPEFARFRPFYIVLAFTDASGQLRRVPIGGFARLSCTRQGEAYSCANNQFRLPPVKAGVFEALPTGYTDKPNFSIPPEEIVVAIRSPDNKTLVLMAPGVARSTIARIWFKDPAAEPYFEEVYRRGSLLVARVKDAVYREGG